MESRYKTGFISAYLENVFEFENSDAFFKNSRKT